MSTSMAMTSAISERVARSYGKKAKAPAVALGSVVLRGAPPGANLNAIQSNGTSIMVEDMARLLKPKTGPLIRFQFMAEPDGTPPGGPVISWLAQKADGTIASGKLILTAAVQEDAVQAVAFVTIDERPSSAVPETNG